MRERYVEQVRLLVRLLPVIAAEEVFALKGHLDKLNLQSFPKLMLPKDCLSGVNSCHNHQTMLEKGDI